MNWKPKELLDDFLIAAKSGKIEIPPNVICIEKLLMPHERPNLPQGKMAVYVFSTETCVLKVGKVNPGSGDRYKYQHYRSKGANSTLAKSLLADKNTCGRCNLSEKNISDWIQKNTDRVNFLIDADIDQFVLGLLEAFLQCRLQPIYEGPANQR